MRASILIATRNRAPQLAAGLASLRERAYEDVEIVVVDDASIDRTPQVLAEYADMVKVHRIEREGGFRRNPSEVFNVGHRLCSADVVIEQGGEVCHLNDCLTPLLAACKPGFVSIARVHHGSPEHMGFVRDELTDGSYQFRPTIVVGAVETCGDKWPVPRVGRHGVRLYTGFERQAPFMFLGAIHRSDFERVGGYDERLRVGNDQDLAERLIKVGVDFVFVGDAVAFHLEHPKT